MNVYESNTAAHQLTLGTNITEGVAGSAYVYNEEGKIRGSEILDLQDSITTLDGIKWTITSLGYKNPSCLLSSATPLRTFYAPRELTTFGGTQLFNFTPKNEDGRDTSFDLLYFDCPAATGGAVAYFSQTSPKVVLNIPSMIGFDNLFIMGAHVNTAESDFSGVTKIGENQSWGGSFCFVENTPQSFSFPSVKTISGGAFPGGAFDIVRLGTCDNSLTDVGDKAFNIARSSPKRLNGIVLGTAEGCNIGENAFLCDNDYELWTVKILGSKPVLADGIVFGRTNQLDAAGNITYSAAKKIIFFIPASAEWDGVRAVSHELTGEEQTALTQRFPSTSQQFAIERFMVVPAEVFHTDGKQFLITMTEEERLAETDVKLAITSNLANITVNGKPYIEDFCKSLARVYPYGTEMTLVADIPEGYKVTEWVGLPKDAVINGNVITFTMTRSLDINLRLSKDTFVFDKQNMLITDGVWNINVASIDETKHTMTLKGEGAVSLVNNSIANDGVLDLRGKIISSDNPEEAWSIIDYGSKCFKNADSVIHFYAPHTTTKWGSQLFNGTWSVKSVIFDTPDLAGQFGEWGWSFNSSEITRFEIRAPKLTSFEKDSTFGKSTFVDSDLDEWDLSGLTSLPYLSLRIAGPGPSGTLKLPSLKTVGYYALKNWSRLDRIELGTNGGLTSVDSNILWNCSSLREIDFGESVNFTCHEKAFMMNDTDPLNISEVCWSSLATPEKSLVDKVLVGRTIADNGEKPVKIRVNENATGWRKMVSPVDKNNESEKLAAAALRRSGEKVGGIYVTESGERLAWVLGFEIKKFAIIIR